MKNVCIPGLREVWGGASPRSSSMINAARAEGKHGMACWGDRVAQKYATARNSGGLSAAPRS